MITKKLPEANRQCFASWIIDRCLLDFYITVTVTVSPLLGVFQTNPSKRYNSHETSSIVWLFHNWLVLLYTLIASRHCILHFCPVGSQSNNSFTIPFSRFPEWMACPFPIDYFRWYSLYNVYYSSNLKEFFNVLKLTTSKWTS